MRSFQELGCPSGKAAEKHHSSGQGPLRVEGIPPASQEGPAHHVQGTTPPPNSGRQGLPWMMLQSFTRRTPATPLNFLPPAPTPALPCPRRLSWKP